MSAFLRLLLIVFSVGTALYVGLQIRKSQMRIYSATFWILLSLILVLMGIFPGAVGKLTKFVGVASPVNFVYLVIIFLLLLQCFHFSMRLSEVEEKLETMVIALSLARNESAEDETET